MSVGNIYQSTKRILQNHKEARYLFAGAFSEVIELASFYILFSILHRLYLANSLSFLFGMLSGFIFHKTWSFAGEHRFKTRYQLLGYTMLGLFNFIMINLLVGYFVNGLSIAPLLGKFFAICITVTWTFAISNNILFRHQKNTPDIKR